MNRKIVNLPASVRERLANVARQQHRPFQDVLQYYAIERFLYRLAQSPHSSKFLLKGALLFLCGDMPLARPTRDIDLEGITSHSVENLTQIVREICREPVEPDGMEFEAGSVRGQSTQDAAEYQGVRVNFTGRLGQARIPMQIDVGFADEVIPGPIQAVYPTLLGMPAPTLRGYAYETVIAEKLQALVAFGPINTRLKDFFDIQQLARDVTFVGPRLQRAITATFLHRHTPLPQTIPAGLTDEFAREKQARWAAYLRRIDAASRGPLAFQEALAEIRPFIMPVLLAAARDERFDLYWPPGGPWREARGA